MLYTECQAAKKGSSLWDLGERRCSCSSSCCSAYDGASNCRCALPLRSSSTTIEAS